MKKELKNWHNKVLGKRVEKALEKNNFAAAYFEGREEALQYILDNIPRDAQVGVGGSSTVREIDLLSVLQEKGYDLFDHNKPGLSPQEKTAERYKQLTSDIFLTSANAITLKGELVNRDGIGNRVASMVFGPKKVIIVAGINKVVKDIEAADERIKLKAAPLNTKRHELPNPCLKTGECADCQGPDRICRITTIIHKRPPLTDIHVVIIGEDLGY